MDEDIGTVLFMVGFVVAGLGVAGWMGYSLYEEQEQLRTAVEVEGTVINASLYVPQGTGPGGPDKPDPDVWYRYTYDGRTYTSNSVFPGGEIFGGDEGGVDGDWARRIVSRYENRSSITVHVNPDEPDESYLVESTRDDLGQVLFTGIGLLIAFLGMNGLLKR